MLQLKIEAVSGSLSPNPVDTEGTLNLSFDIYQYEPGEYKIEVCRLTSRSGNPYTTRSGKHLLIPIKVPLNN